MTEEDNLMDDIIVLKDENGEETEFEYLDTIDYNDKEFIVLLELEEAEETEEAGVVIMEVVENADGEEEFLSVEDDELQAVFEIFKKRMEDEFDSTDEE